MIRTVLLAALALACLHSVAEARPGNASQRSRDASQQVQGCSDPVMQPCGQNFKLKRVFDVAGKKSKGAHNTARPRAWCGWWLGRHLGMPSRRFIP